jgi:hypothetical protein
MNNIFIHELISYQQGFFYYPSIELGITFPKGKKELNKGFSYLIAL